MQKFTALFISMIFSAATFQISALENDAADSFNASSIDLMADPAFKTFFDKFEKHLNATSDLSLPEQRKSDAQFILKENTCHETVDHIANIWIPGMDNNAIPLRIYFPDESKKLSLEKLPVMVYFHGGGWVYGGIEEADAVCRRLANHLGCIVASVGYRLAPEFPFPKPLEDCYSAIKWMELNAHLLGGDNKNIIVAGESAGGNLAGAIALMARDNHGPKLSAQVLVYPVISSVIQDEVYDKCPDHYFLTKDVMRFFWNMYAQQPGDNKSPYASLECAAEFSNLPPALIITAEYDPLAFDANNYALRLQQAGVLVINKSFSRLVHGFLYIPCYEEDQKVQWTKDIGSSLRELGILSPD